MTTLKNHWLATVLALITALLLFGFAHRCNHRANLRAGGSLVNKSSISVDGSATPATPITTTTWLASLDWQAIGMAVGALLTGLGTFYQLVLKWRAGAVGVDAVLDQTKVLFRDAATAQAAFKSPVKAVVTPPAAGLSVYQSSVDAFETLKKMDAPPTMSVPPAPATQEKPANQ